MMISQLLNGLRGKRVLITGGLGFIGSSVALRLVHLGARVTIVDLDASNSGANRFNIHSISDDVELIINDIRDASIASRLVVKQDVIFHCAAQVSHTLGFQTPLPDLQHNTEGTATLMHSVKMINPSCLVLYVGTRGQYGSANQLPVNETHTMHPKGMYEVSKLAAEHVVRVYGELFSIPVIMARLGNIYGPRSQMKNAEQGVANWFIRLALDDLPIPLFDSGTVLRDYLYIDDCVDALLCCVAEPLCAGEAINVGSGRPESIHALASEVINACSTGSIEHRDYSRERRLVEPGDIYMDIRKISRLTPWKPETNLSNGIHATVQYYKTFKQCYW